MITLEQLTKRLESALNKAGNPGVTFALFTDTGKYKRALRKGNDVVDIINGIVSNNSSDVTNTNDGFIVATMTNRIELVIPCRDEEDDVYQELTDENGEIVKDLVQTGNDRFIQSIREWLDKFCSSNEYANLTDDDAVSYDVSAAYSLAATGVRNIIPPVGDCFTFVIYAYYNIIQGGENSRSYTAYLDGQRLPYSTMTLRRVPTNESNVYANSGGVGKSVSAGNVFGVTFECPAFVGQFNSAVKNYLLRGEHNVAHFLTLTLGLDERENYLVIFGQTDATAQGVLNVGQTVSFAETVDEYGIISFPDSYYIYEYTGSSEGSTDNAQVDGDGLIYSFFASEFSSGKNFVPVKVASGSVVVSVSEIMNASAISLKPL